MRWPMGAERRCHTELIRWVVCCDCSGIGWLVVCFIRLRPAGQNITKDSPLVCQ